MSNSRNLASLGSMITTTSGKIASFANNITSNVSINTTNFTASGNSSFGGNTSFSNTVYFSNTTTFTGTVTYNNTANFSNVVTVANLNSSSIANSTFINCKDQTHSNSTFGSSYTIDLNRGPMHLLTLTTSTTISMPPVSAGKSFTLIVNTGTGNYTVNWSGVTWPDAVPPVVTTTSNKNDVFSFVSDGTNWFGFNGGQNF